MSSMARRDFVLKTVNYLPLSLEVHSVEMGTKYPYWNTTQTKKTVLIDNVLESKTAWVSAYFESTLYHHRRITVGRNVGSISHVHDHIFSQPVICEIDQTSERTWHGESEWERNWTWRKLKKTFGVWLDSYEQASVLRRATLTLTFPHATPSLRKYMVGNLAHVATWQSQQLMCPSTYSILFPEHGSLVLYETQLQLAFHLPCWKTPQHLTNFVCTKIPSVKMQAGLIRTVIPFPWSWLSLLYPTIFFIGALKPMHKPKIFCYKVHRSSLGIR